MQRWETLIDEASRTVGNQSTLAKRLGIARENMSQARHGKRRLTTDQVAQIAEIVGVPAAEVWLAQEDYRNPFRVIETALIAGMSALFLFALPSDSRAAARTYDDSGVLRTPNHRVHTRFIDVQICIATKTHA
ncbi:MAG: hypothetical protein QFE16_04490 [Pseudomonadota bacterium]|nr:hypothetical protein [Pseudomonadota bacterium]